MGYFDSDAEEMLEVYLLETRQLTGQLSSVLLDAEKNNAFTQEDIHSIFRVMHTIKSSSAMMGLAEMSSMAHKLEDLLRIIGIKRGCCSSQSRSYSTCFWPLLIMWKKS